MIVKQYRAWYILGAKYIITILFITASISLKTCSP